MPRNPRNSGNYLPIQLHRYCYYCGKKIKLTKKDYSRCCSDECNQKNKKEKRLFNCRLRVCPRWRIDVYDKKKV